MYVLYIFNFIWSPRNGCRMFRIFTADMHFVKVNYIRVHTRKARPANSKSLCLSYAHCQLLRRPDCEPYNTGLGRECYTRNGNCTLFTKNVRLEYYSACIPIKQPGDAFTALDKYPVQIKSTILFYKDTPGPLN